MDNELGKEVVTFEATGLDELLASTQRLEEMVKRAYTDQAALAMKLNDPVYLKRAGEVDRLREATSRLQAIEKGRAENTNRASRLQSGEYLKQAGSLAAIRREAERLAYIEGGQRFRSGQTLTGRLMQDRGALRSRLADLREQRQYRESGALVSQAYRTGVVDRAQARETIAGRQDLLRSGVYLRNREGQGDSERTAAHQDLLERQAALASGLFVKEAALNRHLQGNAGRLGLSERQSLLRSGEYLRGREQTGRLAHSEARQGLSERQAAIASGLLIKEAQLEGRLRADIDRLRLSERRALLESGQFATDIRQKADLQRTDNALTRAERKAELQATHGRLGGTALYGLERSRPGLLAAGVVGSIGIGMAKSGFGGTVEGNALAMEMHLLNREIAGALLPVLKDVTRVFRFVREKVQGLSGTQQDVLGYGIAGLVGLGGLGMAANVGGRALQGLKGIGGLMGLGRAAAPVAGSALAEIGGTAAATYAGGRLAGSGEATAASRMGRFARFGRVAGPTAAAIALASSVGGTPEGSKSYYNLMREAGGSKIGSGVSSFFASLAEGSGALDIMESFGLKGSKQSRADLAAKKVRDLNDPHRNAMIADAGFGSLEDPYERISNAVSVQAAIEAEPGGKLDERKKGENSDVAMKLDLIYDLLKKFNMPYLR